MENLIAILEDMDIPEMRRDVSNLHNVRWLNRNILIRNGHHPKIKEAMDGIKRILIEKE